MARKKMSSAKKKAPVKRSAAASKKMSSTRKMSSSRKPMATHSTSMSAGSSCRGCGGVLRLKLGVLSFAFFLVSAFPAFASWIMKVHWGIWLVVAIILGWNCMFKRCK